LTQPNYIAITSRGTISK